MGQGVGLILRWMNEGARQYAEALDKALETDDAVEEAEMQGRMDLVDNERLFEADETEVDEAVDNKASNESCLNTWSAHLAQRRSQQPVLSNT